MPYFITDQSSDCSGWATIKSDGTVVGCHENKQDAIDQMVAVSIAEDIEPGGERIESGPLAVIVDIDGTLIGRDGRIEETNTYLEEMTDTSIFIVTGRNVSRRDETVKQLSDLKINYSRLFMNSGLIEETENFKKVTAQKLLEDYNIILAIDNNETMRSMYRTLGITALNVSDIPDSPNSSRAINQDAPQYMRDAAKRGLKLNAEGKGGDGLTEKTIREARLMADGQVSDDKWIRIAAWIARHMPDLDAPKNNNSSDSGYPGAGLVAHLLWGSGPSKSNAERTMKYAESVVARIREEESKRWASVNILLMKEKEAKMKNKVERRVKNDVDFELRIQDGQSDGMRFTGYAAVFNSDSEPLPFTERILPGAFKRSLKSRNEIKLFMNHNMDKVLGSTRAKTLKLVEDSTGLLAEAILPDTTDGRDLSVLMKRGDVNSMSFGFSVPNGGDRWTNDGQTRELKEVRLHEVSIVTGFPAYEATSASVRSMDILAEAADVDVDMLEVVMAKLHNGEMLSSDQADFMMEIVSKLREDKPMDTSSEDDYDKTVMEELASLEIKRKHLDLLFKQSQ